MRTTDRGLHPGVEIRVVGAGKRGRGEYVGPVNDFYVQYRCWYDGAIRMAPLAKVKIARRPKVKNSTAQ